MEKKKILVIDDDPDFVLMTREVLEHNGYEVQSAGSGEEGIEKAAKAIPDLVLLDIIMPGMDGLEVLYALKNNYADLAQVPIIMVTGKKEMEVVFQAKGFGAIDYIMKPFDNKELLKIVAEYTGG